MKILAKLMTLAIALSCIAAIAANHEEGDNLKNGPLTITGVKVTPEVTNTDINERDKNDATKTPEDQPNRKEDREVLAAVRRAVVNDNTLSTLAHNIKIMVENGAVTLRGPVKSEVEKAQVEKLVHQTEGVSGIHNHLDIKTN